MQLTQPEIIQILRKRTNLNQAELGSRAFNTNMDSGRTKIKNIELGRQRATEDDLRRISECLEVPVEKLLAAADSKGMPSDARYSGVLISPKILDMFPGLGNYLDMLVNAAGLRDMELIEYLSGKIGEIFQNGPAVDVSSPSGTAAGSEKDI